MKDKFFFFPLFYFIYNKISVYDIQSMMIALYHQAKKL